ncbi:MAG: hypothetical protein HY843_01000 [Bdellovibrio sp.]|nr:hypothetical protein [Bdellovibrio sp.]
MENDSKLNQLISKISEKINDQAWFQQLRGKWDELDIKNKTQIKIGIIVISSFFLLFFSVSSVLGVRKYKKDLVEKADLLQLLQSAHDEVKKLQDISGQYGTNETGSWSGYIESMSSKVGIEKGSLTIGSEKEGANTVSSTEILLNIDVRHINIKQVIQLAHSLESGSRIVKIRNLKVTTDPDLSGYLDSSLSLSCFSVKNKEGS